MKVFHILILGIVCAVGLTLSFKKEALKVEDLINDKCEDMLVPDSESEGQLIFKQEGYDESNEIWWIDHYDNFDKNYDWKKASTINYNAKYYTPIIEDGIIRFEKINGN